MKGRRAGWRIGGGCQRTRTSESRTISISSTSCGRLVLNPAPRFYTMISTVYPVRSRLLT